MHEDNLNITEAELIQPVSSASAMAMEEYRFLHSRSIDSNDRSFWHETALELLQWETEFDETASGGFEEGDMKWFTGGRLNISVNCIDRHLSTRGDQLAIIYEGDDPSAEAGIRRISYKELSLEVNRFGNALRKHGVAKGDRVAIYLPNVPEAAYAMLACARIGAIHSVVFGGFSAEALKDRILDCDCKIVITADEGRRGGRAVPLKQTVDTAVLDCPCVTSVFVVCVHSANVSMVQDRDFWLHDLLAENDGFCEPESMESEDPLFILYTSGSTGKPKGVVHTTAGYILYCALTHKYTFDHREGDILACMADVGWITGHSYIVYGPLCNGTTTFMFDGLPIYPTPSRYWEMVARHRITCLYTAPTAIRLLMRSPDEAVTKCDRSSLRILGSVGEPINPAAWRWYHDIVGDGRCSVVDTYWQTETGGHLLTPIPSVTPVKPGSCTLPFFGIEPVVLESQTGVPIKETACRGVLALAKPWPGVARTIWGDHARFMDTYLRPYPGHYFTGDSVVRDSDGYHWITGRVDDVINKCGHRLGTAEIESALVAYVGCAEAAVIAVPDDLKGEAIVAYCSLKHGYHESSETARNLISSVRTQIGPIAAPDYIILTGALPKTRSGKIMRRILRKIATGHAHELGDISTLADTGVVAELIQKVHAAIPAARPAKRPAE